MAAGVSNMLSCGGDLAVLQRFSPEASGSSRILHLLPSRPPYLPAHVHRSREEVQESSVAANRCSAL